MAPFIFKHGTEHVMELSLSEPHTPPVVNHGISASQIQPRVMSLKCIPCPAGKKCVAFHCLFKHEQDEVAEQEAANQDLPRKRLKQDEPPLVSQEPSLSNNQSDTMNLKSQKYVASIRDGSRGGHQIDAKNSHDLPQELDAAEHSDPPVSKPPDQIPNDAKERPTKLSKPPANVYLSPRLVQSKSAPFQVRFKLLKLLHQELARLNALFRQSAPQEEPDLVLSEQDLISRAVDEEGKIAVEQVSVYSNVIKNRITRYRKMGLEQWKEIRAKDLKGGMKLGEGPPSPCPQEKIESDLTPAEETQLLVRLQAPVTTLSQHGYIFDTPSVDDIEKARRSVDISDGWEKCDRCSGRFQVFPGRRLDDGALTSNGPCRYHHGKTSGLKRSSSDAIDPGRRYTCCGQEVADAGGCNTSDSHVFRVSDPRRLAMLLNYAKTPENGRDFAHSAISIDCEMAYTVHGLELVRLTALSWPQEESLLDVLVRPYGEVLDLNSRFSGVWPEDFAKAESWSLQEANVEDGPSALPLTRSTEGKAPFKIVSTPEVARTLLFSLMTPTMPVVGHGLENDLKATRIIHSSVVDTALLYPHRLGLPYRNSLRSLASEFLNITIQAGDMNGEHSGGHDSGEDARVAGTLARLKALGEWNKMKGTGWTFVQGQIVPPKVNPSASRSRPGHR